MQHPAWWEMDDAIASHFLLHQTEGEHLNTPVGVRRITQSLVHSFMLRVAMGGRQGRTLNRANTYADKHTHAHT